MQTLFWWWFVVTA